MWIITFTANIFPHFNILPVCGVWDILLFNDITEAPWKSVKRGLSPNIIVMVMNESQ